MPFPRKFVLPEISFGTFYLICFNYLDKFWCICTLFPYLQGYTHFKSHFSTRASSLSVKVDILLESQLPKCQFKPFWRFIWSMVWKWQLIVLAISNGGSIWVTFYEGPSFCFSAKIGHGHVASEKVRNMSWTLDKLHITKSQIISRWL